MGKPSKSERRRRKLKQEIDGKSSAPDEALRDGYVRVQIEYADPDCSLWVDINGDTPAPQGVMDAIEFGIGKFALQLGLNPKQMWGYPAYPCPPEDDSMSMAMWEKLAKQPQVIVTGNPESGVVAKQKAIAGLLDSMVLESSKQKQQHQESKADTEMVTEEMDVSLQVAELRAEKLQLLSKVDNLETKVAGQVTKMADMQRQIHDLQKAVTDMSPSLIQKMLTRCRRDCKQFLKQQRVKCSNDWNEVIHSPACLAVLQAAGLSSASLQATASDCQNDEDAPDQDHLNRHLAEVVCRNRGARRDAYLEIFKFVVGEDAESLIFED